MTEAARELADTFGGVWGEHPRFPVEQWQYEVANGDTRASYWDFVLVCIESSEGDSQ